MKSYIIHLFYFVLLTSCSCSNKKVNLVIQNFSMRDSLRTIIKINGEVKFDDLIKKALVSVSASRKELHNLSDSVIVEVNIPELNLKSNAQASSCDLKHIVITIKSDFTSPFPEIKDSLPTKPTKEYILIAFKRYSRTDKKSEPVP